MENQEQQTIIQSNQVVVNELSKQVVSELDLMTTLNLSRSTLDTLRREKDFPYIRCSLTARCYLVNSVVEWLKGHELR